MDEWNIFGLMKKKSTVDAVTEVLEQSPMVLKHAAKRASKVQLRVADAITKFAGSMAFVYIHVAVFAVWCSTGLFGLDKFPFNFLTLTVSLEAIFLATFVMIGQNRQSDFQQAKADHDFHMQEKELRENTDLTRQIYQLTELVHELVNKQPKRDASGKFTKSAKNV